jgi:glutaconyl-CoA/methylmalonyl-CoA decarboxylase subunit gamma
MSEYVFTINQKEYHAELTEFGDDQAVVTINGTAYQVGLKQLGRSRVATTAVTRSTPQPAPAAAAPAAPKPTASKAPVSAAASEAATVIRAPLPGRIIDIKLREGDAVKAGQTVMVMEAMKMENQIQATCDGRIRKIFVNKTDNVAEGDNLVEIARSAMSTL